MHKLLDYNMVNDHWSWILAGWFTRAKPSHVKQQRCQVKSHREDLNSFHEKFGYNEIAAFKKEKYIYKIFCVIITTLSAHHRKKKA